MNKSRSNKLLYILPEASKVTHMKYNVEFIKSLSEDVDVSVIIEKGDSDLHDFVTSVVYINKANINQNKIIRVLSTLYYILKFRHQGYKKVYVHYSFLSAILASLVMGNKVYYWNCGLPFKYKRSKLVMCYEFIAYHMIDYLVIGTAKLGKMYSSYYKFTEKKIKAVPNWININQINGEFENIESENILKELQIEKGNLILFFNQRLSERKGAHYIIPIMKSVPDNVIMIVTNDGPYKEKLLKDLRINDFESRVRILGKVEHKKVLEILSITDVYVLSSEEEGMSHSLLEAMCAGVSTVSFDVGSTKEMYPKEYQDYVINDLSINEYINKLNFLLENGSARIKFAEALKNKVKDYDKQKVLSEFIEKILV